MIVVAVAAAVIVLAIQITRLARLRENYLENFAGHTYARGTDGANHSLERTGPTILRYLRNVAGP